MYLASTFVATFLEGFWTGSSAQLQVVFIIISGLPAWIKTQGAFILDSYWSSLEATNARNAFHLFKLFWPITSSISQQEATLIQEIDKTYFYH